MSFSHLVFHQRWISLAETEANWWCPLWLSSEWFITVHHAFLEGQKWKQRKEFNWNEICDTRGCLPRWTATSLDHCVCQTAVSLRVIWWAFAQFHYRFHFPGNESLRQLATTKSVCFTHTLVINGTPGSLRLPNLRRNEGDRTALRSIWWSSDNGSNVSLCSKYSYKSLIESVYAGESEVAKFKRYFRWITSKHFNSLSSFAGAAQAPYDEIINTKQSAIRFIWFIFEIDGMLQGKDEKMGNEVIITLHSFISQTSYEKAKERKEHFRVHHKIKVKNSFVWGDKIFFVFPARSTKDNRVSFPLRKFYNSLPPTTNKRFQWSQRLIKFITSLSYFFIARKL